MHSFNQLIIRYKIFRHFAVFFKQKTIHLYIIEQNVTVFDNGVESKNIVSGRKVN